MSKETKLPVDAAAIKARMKETGYKYKDIEEASEGTITENSLKHFLNKGVKVDEATLNILAELLGCSKNDLIDKGYLLSTNLPFEVNQISGNLYLRNREDINRYYAVEIKKFRNKIDLKRMLDEAHHLFLVLSSDDYVFDKTVFVKAFNIIKDFFTYNCIANRDITEIPDDEAKSLYSKISAASGDYNTQQAFLMFLYVFILFDAIFMEEAVASAAQLVPERKTEKADQFFELSYRSEKMRNVLIELVLYKGYQFDMPNIADFNIDVIVIGGISLILAACEKCYQHIHGDYVDSEYLNRVSFSAILTRLEKIFSVVGIEIPESNGFNEIVNMNLTRFGRHYNSFKIVFNSLNPPRKRRNKELEAFCWGQLMK
jgi:hypothetical protein